jgi:glycosyltransferase involved in cell wall biosynthesis
MRISFLLHHADMSGGTRVVGIYAQQLQDRGHDVTVYSTPYPYPTMRAKLRAIVKREPWPKRGGQIPSHLDRMNVRHVLIEDVSELPDADIVIATWWLTAEWVANLPASKGKKVHFIQGYETWGGPPERVNAVWQLPMQRIVISKWLEDLAREKFGETTITRIPNAVDRKQFDAPARGKQPVHTVGMLYSTRPFKGLDLALKTIEKAKAAVGEIRVLGFGQDPISEELPLPPGSQYTRDPAQNIIKDIYAACDVWLCASKTEGFHLPPLEAMACRCPVVSSSVGGPMDIVVNGVNGYLVDIGDWEGLSDGLVSVLKLSEANWRKLSDAAYDTASRYSWYEVASLFEATICKGISTRQPAARKLAV